MKIKINGETRNFELDKVRDGVVKLGNAYYWRDSPHITKVKTSQGMRFRRRESPLIRQLKYNNKYADIKDVVVSESGMEFNSADPDVVKVDGDWTLRKFCLEIDGKLVLKSKSNMITDITGVLIQKDKCVRLGTHYTKRHGKAVYCAKTYAVKDYEGSWMYDNDGYDIIDGATGEKRLLCRNSDEFIKRGANRTLNVFESFSEHNSGDLNRISTGRAFHDDRSNFEYVSDNSDILVSKAKAENVREIVRKYSESVIRDNTNKIRKRINDNYSDAGPDENNAKEINLDYGTQPGGHVFHESNKKDAISASKKLTGGLAYTFGVEFETAAGQLSNRDCSLIHVDKIGDRSIGAYEYVSGILHGTNGINKVEKMCETLSAKTMIDDKCSIHVHVGGTGDSRTTTPKFGRKLSVNLVALGSKIEDSLYSMSPPSRHKKLKHCAPIKRWGKITQDKYDYLLGSFLFGGDRNGRINQENINSGYSFKGLKSRYEGTRSKWIGGRYKWLNLLNCHTGRPFNTIEVRMWAGSTNFEKIHNYILLSLAIVWYAENREHDIYSKKNITISDIVSEAYSSKKDIKKQLLTFIETRTKQFKTKRKGL